MIYNISEIKDLNEQLEAGLQNLKREYLKPKMSEEQLRKLQKKMEEAKRMNRANRNKKRMIRLAAAAAALAGIFVILPNTSAGIAHAMEQIPVIGSLVEVVTFRDYSYETERNVADIEVPEVKVADQPEDSQIQENLNRTTEQINAEIQEITDKLIEEFEENLDEEMGHQDIMVKSEVLTTTEEYFTLKLICYQGAGSGYAWNVYYTIDLNTGERLALKDLFQEGADYITAISENIKEQMQAQMDADENVYYWLHDEIEDWIF